MLHREHLNSSNLVNSLLENRFNSVLGVTNLLEAKSNLNLNEKTAGLVNSLLVNQFSSLTTTNRLLKSSNLSEANYNLNLLQQKTTCQNTTSKIIQDVLSRADSTNPLDSSSLLKTSSHISRPLVSSINTHSKTLGQLTLPSNSSKLTTSVSKLVKTRDVENNNEQVSENLTEKEPYSNESSFIREEFLQVDSLIDFINAEQTAQQDLLNKLRRLKTVDKEALFFDNSLITFKNKLNSLQCQKNSLINLVSSSLLRTPDFKNINDPTRAALIRCAALIIDQDPEFILKLALYTRRELNIRVTANFLLCLASYCEKCRPFLNRYFRLSIMLPSDWIEVAEQYQLFMDKSLNFAALPCALRKCMCEKFVDFDAYQLAKYNKEKSRSAKNKAMADFKHIKVKLKDDSQLAGSEVQVEDKFIKTLSDGGLKINDRISLDVIALEACDNFKIDIVARQIIKPVEPVKSRKSLLRRPQQTTPQQTEKSPELNETILMRLTVDLDLKRLLHKGLIKKVWTKKVAVTNNPIGFENLIGNFYKPKRLFIDVKADGFVFGLKIDGEEEILLSSYSHSMHGMELSKVTHVRVSGCSMRLKGLHIESKDKVELDSQMSEESEAVVRQRSFTLKQLIRQLHICKPVNNVLSLLGKKYPESFEKFIELKMTGDYESEKCGKRMKLPIPETWETQVSMKGNKASVWEQLIDNKKLPYMAMLRNLRNMIKCGISEKHHQWVIKKLQDEGAVVNSKQFPFRFFTAYEVLDELRQEYLDYVKCVEAGEVSVEKPKFGSKKGAKKPAKTLKSSDFNYNESILQRYKTALDNALKVATTFNISPIRGRTLIFLSIGPQMSNPPNKRISKSVTSIADIATLLALMFIHSCEASKLVAYNNNCAFENIELEKGTILDNMASFRSLQSLPGLVKSNASSIFADIVDRREHFDNLIVLGGGDIDVMTMQRFLRKYRQTVNEELLFVNVNLLPKECGLAEETDYDHENDVTICGYSDSILRFVAEKGNQGQLVHIENIDKSYDLPPLSKKKSQNEKSTDAVVKLEGTDTLPAVVTTTSRWKTVKVFISSTFRDMHSEREILVKTVFPMLRAKLASYMIDVHEIDMRWGVTEKQANDNQTLEICLDQVLECDYFIGILGDRYGHTLSVYPQTRRPEHAWLAQYQAGASVTELEIECQLRKAKDKLSRSFFYFRDKKSFINQVPSEVKELFVDADMEKVFRLQELKKRVKAGACEVYEDYEVSWLRLDNNEIKSEACRPLLGSLDGFAKRVFQNLFNSIVKNEYEEVAEEVLVNETVNWNRINAAFVRASADLFCGRSKLIKILDKLLVEVSFKTCINTSTESSKAIMDKQNCQSNIILIHGDTGCGKSTFICHFFSERRFLSNTFVYSVGSFPKSQYTTSLLKCFSAHMCVTQMSREMNESFDIESISNSDDLDYLKKVFSAILHTWSQANRDVKFQIVLDGCDKLCHADNTIDESFSWLPADIPACFTLVFTAQSSGSTKSILDRLVSSNHFNHTVKLHTLQIESLDTLDKAEMARAVLDHFNKRLDETPFNNQMKLLTGKREAASPLYLSLACEELRVHGKYETLSAKIKELPAKLNLLVQQVLARLETEYGRAYTNSAFVFLACAGDEGLSEQELSGLMSIFSHLSSLTFFDKNTKILDSFKYPEFFEQVRPTSTSRLLSFVQTISSTFLRAHANGQNLSLKDANVVTKGLQIRYNKNGSLTIEQAHQLMSLYYWHLIDESFNSEWTLTNRRAYTTLPFHLAMADCFFEIESLLTDLNFIKKKCDQGLVNQLMQDYDLHESNPTRQRTLSLLGLADAKALSKTIKKKKMQPSKKFLDFRRFFIQNYHLLAKSPQSLYQEAMNEPEGSHVASELKLMIEEKGCLRSFLFEWVDKVGEKSVGEIESPMRINDFVEGICAVAICGDRLACGTEDCQVKVFSAKTAAFIRGFQGHAGRINQLCFVGSDGLCSVSSDGLVSLWSVSTGIRIKVINKHNNHVVSGCAVAPNGKNFVTVGWDCSVKIWKSTDGGLEGELRGHNRPINCAAFDPTSDKLATGCWDSCIRLFNIVSRTRIAVLRGHNTSVRSITYSHNGTYLASSSIDGQVKLWNAFVGCVVATLSGHSLPVNSVCFSPKGQLLATGSTDQRCRLWTSSVGKQIRVINEKTGPITSVVFFKDNGEMIAAGYHSGHIRIFQTLSGALLSETQIHQKPITRLKITDCGNYLVSATSDGSCSVLYLSGDGQCQHAAELVSQHKSAIHALAINIFGWIVTGSENSFLCVYADLNLVKETHDQRFSDDALDKAEFLEEKNLVLTLKANSSITAHKSPITAITFNVTGDKFASCSRSASICVWSLSHVDFTCTEVLTINAAHSDWINDLCWSNLGDYMVSAGNDCVLKVWNAKTGKECSLMQGHQASVSSCGFRYGCVVSTCVDGCVKVWSQKGHEITTLKGHQGKVNACDLYFKTKKKLTKSEPESFVNDDESLWADKVDEADNVKWRESHKERLQNRKKGDDDVEVEEILLATVSEDGTLRIWRPVESESLNSLEGHNGKVNSVVIDETGLLATASADKSVNVWNVKEFMNKIESGHLVQDEVANNKCGHVSEVTTVYVSKLFIFSGSVDGMLITWRRKDVDGRLAGLQFTNKLRAHDFAVRKICLLEETFDHTLIASCGEHNQRKCIRLWKVDNRTSNLRGYTTVFASETVFYMCLHKKNDKSYLVSVEAGVTKLLVRVYELVDEKSLSCHSKLGGCVSMLNSLVSRVSSSSSHLYISLVENKILMLSFDSLITQFKTYVNHEHKTPSQVPRLKAIDAGSGSDMVWFNVVTTVGSDIVLAGSWKGDVYAKNEDCDVLLLLKNCHKKVITEIIGFAEDRVLTASLDGTVKVWSGRCERQLGQFNLTSGVSAVCQVTHFSNALISSNSATFIVGDQMGRLKIIRWHDRD